MTLTNIEALGIIAVSLPSRSVALFIYVVPFGA